MKLLKIKILSVALMVLITAQSCNKYLDTEPDNRTEINTVQKLAQLVATAYPDRDYLYFTEAASDNSEDKGNGVGSITNVISTPYAWQDFVGSDTGSPTAYWNSCYAAIAAANEALSAFEKNKFGNEALPYKGEALIARAYAHFMLVNFFAKVYDLKGSNDSPGIPYVTSPETKVIQNYERGTVASTYQKIEQDLTTGLALLNGTVYDVPKYRFTPAAASAFAARFYLFKGDWQKVIDYSAKTVPGGDFASNIRPVNSTLRTMGTAEFNLAFTRSDQKYNLLLASTYSLFQRQNTPRQGYGQELVKMFGINYNFTGKATAHKIFFNGVPNYTTYKYKELFFRTSPNAPTGVPYLMMPLFTVDEVLMNRAEAYAELGQIDNAVRDINTFYASRILNYNPTADLATINRLSDFYGISDQKQAVIKTILETKKFEFLQEGIRWLDIIRRGLTVVHNVYDTNNDQKFVELKAGDLRRVFQIPEEAKLSGVPLNPR